MVTSTTAVCLCLIVRCEKHVPREGAHDAADIRNPAQDCAKTSAANDTANKGWRTSCRRASMLEHESVGCAFKLRCDARGHAERNCRGVYMSSGG